MEKGVNSLDKINVVGDRVLVKPRKESERSDSGLYLPPGVKEKEKIQYGYVVKSGPGYPIPLPVDNDEPWKSSKKSPWRCNTPTERVSCTATSSPGTS